MSKCALAAAVLASAFLAHADAEGHVWYCGDKIVRDGQVFSSSQCDLQNLLVTVISLNDDTVEVDPTKAAVAFSSPFEVKERGNNDACNLTLLASGLGEDEYVNIGADIIIFEGCSLSLTHFKVAGSNAVRIKGADRRRLRELTESRSISFTAIGCYFS